MSSFQPKYQRNRELLVGNISDESVIFSLSHRLSDQSLTEINQLLAIWGVTALQHNALRVLYVKDPDQQGLPSGEIGKRLYTRVPDVTRLLDRMADKGWVTRERDPDNRRVVLTKITQIGMELVESIFSPLRELEQNLYSNLSPDEKTRLIWLLNKALLDVPDKAHDN